MRLFTQEKDLDMFYAVTTFDLDILGGRTSFWTGSDQARKWSSNPLDAQRYRTFAAAQNAAARVSALEDVSAAAEAVRPSGSMAD